MVSLADLASSSGEHSHVQKDKSSPEAYGARKNHLQPHWIEDILLPLQNSLWDNSQRWDMVSFSH